LVYDNVEVPNSQGAKTVWLTHAELDVGKPTPSAAGTDAYAEACIILGKAAPTAVNISQVGALQSKKTTVVSNGTAAIGVAYEGPEQKVGLFPVPMHGDGKYYFTIAVKGAGASSTATVAYRCDFLIKR
jgi:hypothetical protein